MKIYNIHSGHPKRESFSKFRLWIEKGMGGKTRVFGKNRVFSTKPGFPGRTSVLLANPGYFKGLEAQGKHNMRTPGPLVKVCEPPLGKIQPKEPRPQPFRQPLFKHSASSTSQYSSVSSVIRSTISHVSDRGRQWTSNIIQRSIAIHPFQRPHPSTAGVLECHWIRSRPQPLSSPTLALSLIRCNASSVGIWPA